MRVLICGVVVLLYNLTTLFGLLFDPQKDKKSKFFLSAKVLIKSKTDNSAKAPVFVRLYLGLNAALD